MLKSICKKIFFILLLCGLALPVSASEFIEHFDSDIIVNPDGSLDIKETIAVRHEGIKIRRGIYRNLSTIKGESYNIISVTRNGLAEPWFTERTDTALRLNTGDDSYLPSPDTSVFVIRYTMHDALRTVYKKPYNELYLNVTGKWGFPINTVTVNVHYPENTEIISRYAYQTDKPAQQYQNNDTFTFYNIPQNHEITIAEIFSKGTVTIRFPKVWRWVLNSLLLTLLYYILAWFFFGKDPAPRAIVPDWEPPKNLSPLECAYINNNGKTPKNSFFLHILWLLHQKVISVNKITPLNSNKIKGFQIDSSPNANKTDSEAQMFNKKFTHLTLLNNTPNASVARYTQKLDSHIAAHMEKFYYHKRGLLTFIGALIVPLVWILLFPQYIGGIIISYLLILTIIIFRSYMVGVFLGFNLLPLMLAINSNTPILISAVPYIVLILVFKYLMFQPTIPGQRQKEKIAGIKMFLKTITGSNISPNSLMDSKDNTGLPMARRLTPSDMEALFPYAVALGLEKNWEKKFKTIFGTDAYKELTTNNIYYQNDFTQQLRHTSLNTARFPQQASSSSPFSSGSGGFGGGFSGGGFGGGGGGGR